MRAFLSLSLGLVVLGGFALANANSGTNNAERKTNKEVMKAANGGGENSLFNKVVGGKATAEEKLKLVDLLIDLVENEPAKGDAMEWKMAAGTTMLAAAKVAVGREGAVEELKAAGNCKACHDKFKGK